MNGMKWFRVYSEIKDDPKILEMDDHQRWLWICLLAMASESTDRGVISGVRLRGLAASLRTDESRLADTLSLLVDLEMIDYDESSRTIEITHWNERQYDKPSDTPAALRDRKRKSRQSHADVTPSHAIEEIRIDTDTDTDTEIDTRAPAPVSSLSACTPADDVLFDALAEVHPATIPFKREFANTKQADKWHEVSDVLGLEEATRCVEWCIVNQKYTIGKIVSSAQTWHNNNRKAQATNGQRRNGSEPNEPKGYAMLRRWAKELAPNGI